MQLYIALAKSKKSKNPRSQFLSVFMRELSNHDDAITAFSGKNTTEFKQKMMKMVETLAAKMPNSKKSGDDNG